MGLPDRVHHRRSGICRAHRGPSGGPWGDTSRPRFHHLGFWTSDVEAGADRLSAAGFAETFSGCPYGRPFVYHDVASIGAQIELVDVGRQPAFLASWQPSGPAMESIEETSPG